jgi:Kyanoviridae SbcC-like subunit of palindrome specific endonuclease
LIKFSKIRWMNLLSTGNDFMEIELDRSRTTLMVGENGAGKSTVLDALSFALFNKPFRKVNRGQLVNSITNKNLLVECEFSTRAHSYLVRRGAKPNVFEIYRDDKLVEPPADARDYQQMLERDVLKLNHKSFTQVVMLGSANFTPFMRLTAAQRREVIEDLLDIQVFSVMATLLRERNSTVATSEVKNNTELRDVTARLETSERHVTAALQDNEAVIVQKQQTIANIEVGLQEKSAQAHEWQTKVDKASSEMQRLDSVVEERQRLYQEAMNLVRDFMRHEETLRFLAEHGNCPQCKQVIGPDVVEDARLVVETTRLKKIEIDMMIAATDNGIARRTEEEKRRVEGVAHIGTLLNQARHDMCDVERLKREVVSLSQKNEVVKNAGGVLDDLRARMEELLSARDRILREQATCAAATVMLRDGGVRAMIVRQYVPVLNALINKYLAALDFFVDFRIDEEFNEIIKSRFRDEFSYESFSEGEKLRIDLALLFSWRAVARMRSSTSVNILVMDEILDGSLDAAGADEFMKVLAALAPDEHVFVISHRGDQLADKFDRVLKFEKTRNFSRMEEAA